MRSDGKGHFPVIDVPDPRRAVRAGRGHAPPVRSKSNAEYNSHMLVECPRYLAAGGLPDLDGTVGTRGCQETPLGVEGDPADLELLTGECQLDRAVSRVPQQDLFPTAGGHGLPVGAECNAPDIRAVLVESDELPTVGGLPDANRPVVAGRGDPFAVRADSNIRELIIMSIEAQFDCSLFQIPDLGRLVLAATDEKLAIGSECD